MAIEEEKFESDDDGSVQEAQFIVDRQILCFQPQALEPILERSLESSNEEASLERHVDLAESEGETEQEKAERVAARWMEEEKAIADRIQDEQQPNQLADLDGFEEDSLSEADSDENEDLLAQIQAEQMDYLEVG